jgi:flagellar biosynthetic protein FliQ
MDQGKLFNHLQGYLYHRSADGAPFLLVSLVIGIVISVFQAATQIHEQNVIFVPKIVATCCFLIFLGSWIISLITGFTERLFSDIGSYL